MTDIEVLEIEIGILCRARRLIKHASHWTQGAYARDKSGRKCPYSSRRAAQWCAAGAILHTGHATPKVALKLIERPAGFVVPLWILNDQGTHATVMRKLDEMIAERGTKIARIEAGRLYACR